MPDQITGTGYWAKILVVLSEVWQILIYMATLTPMEVKTGLIKTVFQPPVMIDAEYIPIVEFRTFGFIYLQ